MKIIKTNTKWSDKTILKFIRQVAVIGSYGKYKNCRTLEQKLKKFKQLNNIK